MTKSVYVIAIFAAAISTSAVAKDLKQEKKATAPAVTATQMSDSEMDKVTAGGAEVSTPGPDVTVILPPQGAAAIGATATGNLHAPQAANLVGGDL
jgi:hypothetical protein